MTLTELAQKLRHYIEKAAKSLDDAAAIESVELFPMWKADGEYAANDRVRYDGVLYKCLINHTAQENWTPVDAPSLWSKVLAGQGGTDIGEWVQPDSTNPYMTGDKVMFNGEEWISTIDNNVWPPDAYGWQRV